MYEHKQEKMPWASEIHGGKLMISLRPEADDYGRTLLGLVSCEGESDVTTSTCTLFNDAVKLTRFLTTKNYETNDNINTHKILPQIGHALMGFRRRSGLAEGLQSNYISIVLTNAE